VSDTEETTPTIIVPVPSDRLWFDPRVIMAACDVQYSTIDLTLTAITLLAPADPTRVAIGIMLPRTITPLSGYGPWPDPDQWSLAGFASGQMAWFDVHKYLNMVNLAWYCFGDGTTLARVVTVRRNT
jgi:hypothetical protein